MKCVIPSQNVKIIARAIHSLAKVGDEVFILPSEDELIFSTINAAKSAFAEFRMCRSFFSSFNMLTLQGSEASIKITMKSCLNVFKNAHGMDKQVENCEIRLKPDCTQMIFQIKFINSSVKKYYIPVVESDQMEAKMPSDAPNQICASSKLLAAAVKNFRHSEDEITVIVNTNKTVIKNHLELKKDLNLMRTELCYHQSEFESYVVENPTNVTFCLKEFRAVVAFAEPANLPVIISFTEPGRPVVFRVLNHPAYEANYVVSTLQPNNFDRSSQVSTCRNTDSPLATPSSQPLKRSNKTSTPYSFIDEEEPVNIPSARKKRHEMPEATFSPRPEPIPSTSYQTSIEKSVNKFLSRPDLGHESEKESDLRHTSTSAEKQPSTSYSLSQSGPGELNLPYLNEAPSTSQVVPESEPALSISGRSHDGSLCRVETVIQGMNTSSRPSEELLKTVFSRCFSKDHFLNALVGHDILLEEASDREAT